MPVVDLYTGIYQALSRDDVTLNHLGLEITDPEINKARKIQKRSSPQNVVKNLPIITFYSPGGRRDPRNDQVFGSTFVFDIYTNDDVELAQLIAERIFMMFNDEFPEFGLLETFKTEYDDEYESKSSLANTYCYTIIMTFFISLPG